jgi:polysaccharide biosynthesis transport protein
MTTEAALVSSEPVVQQVNDDVSPDVSSDDISATVPPNTSTIVIKVRASSSEQAKAWAQAVAKGYLSYREDVASAAQDASLAKLNDQIAKVRKDLARASRQAQRQGPDSQAARESQALTEQLISLQDLANTARSTDTDPGTLVTSASNGARSGLSSSLVIAAGAILGLLVGIALGLLLGIRDKRVHARSAHSVAGLPVLATLTSGRGRGSQEADRQTYQRLRTSVLAMAPVRSAIAVSGLNKNDTSAAITWELGRSMARAGYRVVVVIAGAQESLALADDGESKTGLAQALREGRDPIGLLVNHDGVALLNAGAGIVEAQELLSGEAFGRMLSELESSFDYVLIATGPAVLPSELATARHADILLLVGRDGVSSRVAVSDVAERARLVGVRPGGIILRSRRRRRDDAPGGRQRVKTTSSNAPRRSQAAERQDQPPAAIEPR